MCNLVIQGYQMRLALIRMTLNDTQWAIIASHCLDREYDTRRPWRDPQEEFGKRNSVFKRFPRWVKAGAFFRIFRALTEDADFNSP